MELRDLAYFLACVEHGSVTAAARAVHVAQPTLSHALARLEREAGARLLDRRPRERLRPTAAGQLLRARAQETLAAVSGFGADLAALNGLERGELLVGSIQSLNATLLPTPIASFVARYPGIALAVRTHCPMYVSETVFKKCPELLKPISEDEVKKFKEDIQNMKPEDFFKDLKKNPPPPSSEQK